MEGLVILGDQNKKIQHLINLIATLSQPPITSVTSQLSYQIYRKISWISHHLKKVAIVTLQAKQNNKKSKSSLLYLSYFLFL